MPSGGGREGARPGEVTRLLRAAGQGSRAASDQLLPIVYEELRRLARGLIHRERGGHTLQPTALVHEAYVRLVGQSSAGFTDRPQFFAAAATAMRRVLVDHARARDRLKRGGNAHRTSLDQAVDSLEQRSADLPQLDEALDTLRGLDPEKARLIELRFFVGLSMKEAAAAMGTSLRTTERHWALARAWLHERLLAELEDPEGAP